MTTPSIVDRLLDAITTEVQDAIRLGIGGNPRLQARLDTMIAAIVAVERLTADLEEARQLALPRFGTHRAWLDRWTTKKESGHG